MCRLGYATGMDSTVIKVDGSTAPRGPEGEFELALGTSLAMRLWRDEPPQDTKPPRARDYETVGYVISGRATLELEGGTIELHPGDSWVVPIGVTHRYIIEEPFTAVEATHPPAPLHGRDELPIR
jgi:quercetin dioxygenase-like cupin family protein